MGDNIAQTRFENVSKHSNDPLLVRGNTLRSGEDSLKRNELIELCTNLQTRVLDLEKIKTTQAKEIVSLKRRVKKFEQKKRSRTHGLKRLYKVGLTSRVESSGDEESLGEDASKQGRINAIDADEDITLVNDQDDVDMFDVNTDCVKPKLKGNVVEEPSVLVSAASTKVSAAITTTTTTILTLRKGIVITELAKRAEEKRNKPPTKTQQKKTMITYLKNMEDLVEGSSKRVGDELEQEVTKNQKVDDVQETTKVDDDQEAAKIKELMKIIPDEEEVAIDAISLATKPPTIVD
ncbi:hypothetical protein Tco_1334609 [Tanacetum coccineum]